MNPITHLRWATSASDSDSSDIGRVNLAEVSRVRAGSTGCPTKGILI